MQSQPTDTPATATRAGGRADRRARISGRTLGLIFATGILFVIMASMSHTFLSRYTMFIVSRQISFYVLIALSQAVCLVVGGMNLSVGAIGSLTTVLLGLGLDNWGLSPWLAVPIALSLGCLSGVVNGLLTTKLKIDSFIITLSMMFVYMGLRSGISGGSPYKVPASFTLVGQAKYFDTIPCVFLIMLAVLAVVAYMFQNTVFGRRLLATGGNVDAARLSGINTDSMIVWAHVLSGFFASLAAILWASQNGTCAPETGDDWLIISFAVSIIGGTGLNGGVVSALGIFMGGAIYRLIQHGLIEMRTNPYYANSFLGTLILLAIVVDRVREIYSQRRKSDRP